MPIIKTEKNGHTIYRGVTCLEEFSPDAVWEEHGVSEHTDRATVISQLAADHLYRSEKLVKQCALLLVAVQSIIGDSDTLTERAIEELAQDVLCEAGRLAEYHPLSGLDLDVSCNEHSWRGPLGDTLDEAIRENRIKHIASLDQKTSARPA